MHRKFSLAVFTCCLALSLRAEVNLDTLLAGATSDPKNAPALIARAVKENQKSARQIVGTMAAAMPDHTVGFVSAALDAVPEELVAILQGAISAQPRLAIEITTLALGKFPERAGEIIKAAIEVAPEEMRAQIAALGNKLAYFSDAGGARRVTARGSFPKMPIRSDLISPSQ